MVPGALKFIIADFLHTDRTAVADRQTWCQGAQR
jgi:hypothetical protein